MILEKEGKILMLKRNDEPKGKLDLLGGFVDEGETIEEAAVREAKEESGFDVKIIKKLGQFDYFDREEKTMHIFIGEIVGGELKASKEGAPVWTDPSTITADDLAFPQVHVEVIKQYGIFRHSK
ncbi:NUDIX hydrolase [Patescibacteria group bacterium]|nr:NUDIX hydrolase [Patescibacteria group bacterium]